MKNEKKQNAKIQRHHQENKILGDIDTRVQTRRRLNFSLLSKINPKKFAQASEDKHWVNVMKEELNQTEKNETWELVLRPKDKNVIGEPNGSLEIYWMKMDN
jgi:hypothetical protein